jgi:hypothetical protein
MITFGERDGAPGRVRTRDPLITNQVLYQLSYKGNEASLGGNAFVVKQKIGSRLASMVNGDHKVLMAAAGRGEPFAAANDLWLQAFVMYHWRLFDKGLPCRARFGRCPSSLPIRKKRKLPATN